MANSQVGDGERTLVTRSNLRDLYWSPYQQLTHLAAAGCGMSPGDLIGTGTVSGEVMEGKESRKVPNRCADETSTRAPAGVYSKLLRMEQNRFN
jgi:2-keto-4-pentenoate hydratase/2-oxohepta-3-ene-1,7-dioic acid hydratase in catechol pathway